LGLKIDALNCQFHASNTELSNKRSTKRQIAFPQAIATKRCIKQKNEQ